MNRTFPTGSQPAARACGPTNPINNAKAVDIPSDVSTLMKAPPCSGTVPQSTRKSGTDADPDAPTLERAAVGRFAARPREMPRGHRWANAAMAGVQLGAILAVLHRPAPSDAPRNPVRGVP